MICCSCENANTCTIFKTLRAVSNNFCINECEKYEDGSKYKYKKIADHDDLLHLIYDYFTGQVDSKYSEEQTKTAIIHALMNL